MNALDYKFSTETPKSVLQKIKNEPLSVITAHAEMIYEACKNNEYSKPLEEASLIVADGVGLVWALSFLGRPVLKCSGSDITEELITNNFQIPTFLWGGDESVVRDAAKNCSDRGLKVVGFSDGYNKNINKILEDIKNSKASLVLIGMGGSEKQLILVNEVRDKLGISAITVGGYINVLAGKFVRSPKFFQKIGMEWLWRTAIDPKRVAKIPKLVGFVLITIRAKYEK